MRLNLCAAAWVVVALCSACRSRALPARDGGPGSPAGSAGAGTIPAPQGDGGTGGAATGDAGLGGGAGGVAGTAGDAGLGGGAGTAGGAGVAGAGATTGGAGLDGSGGGAAGAAGGATGGVPNCSPATIPGQPCAVVGSVCSNVVCDACSNQYWRIVTYGPCVCDSAGRWSCPGSRPPGSVIGDCLFDPPLECDLAQLLYEDATCQTHPPCSASPPP